MSYQACAGYKQQTPHQRAGRQLAKMSPVVAMYGDQNHRGVMMLSKLDDYTKQVMFETMHKPPIGAKQSKEHDKLFMSHKDLDKEYAKEVKRHEIDAKKTIVEISRAKMEVLQRQHRFNRHKNYLNNLSRRRTDYLQVITEEHEKKDAYLQQLEISIKETNDKQPPSVDPFFYMSPRRRSLSINN